MTNVLTFPEEEETRCFYCDDVLTEDETEYNSRGEACHSDCRYFYDDCMGSETLYYGI